MDSLFDDVASASRQAVAPLAVRMRPKTLAEFVGQPHAVGPGTWLRHAIETGSLFSVILYGPPGTGKTSLARVVAETTSARFVELSAVTSGVADVRAAIEAAEGRLSLAGDRTILFIDEIHRFSKSQQDALLHAVEDRIVTLIGATTENPYFEVNAPLVSRSRVIVLEPLTDQDVREIVGRAVTDPRGLGGSVEVDEAAMSALVALAGGDARVALNTLEVAAAAASAGGRSRVTLDDVRDATPSRTLPYDKDGDVHYDVASAFIKSMRGSDADAAVYWLARMVHGGEDPKFIARRILIFASEDVGNADPQALLVAHAAFKAAESVGWPECRINLAQAAIYMAMAPKSNASYVAIDAALDDVRNGPARAVPPHLRDRHRPGAEDYPDYRYPHDDPRRWVEQRYLPEGLDRGAFFSAGDDGWEAERQAALDAVRGPAGEAPDEGPASADVSAHDSDERD